MTDEKPDAADEVAAADHPSRFVSRTNGGGFAIEVPGGETLTAAPDRGGWRIDGSNDTKGWRLRRSEEGGFVLEHPAEGREIARTMPLVGAGAGASLRYLLLEDGRLFRIAFQRPRDPRYELSGWEVSGSIVTARPTPDGWRLEPQPASCGLADLAAPALMLAAEVLEADRSLERPET